MSTLRSSAIVLAASEMLPAEPGDLSALLADPLQRTGLLSLAPDEHSSPLTAYLCAEIDRGRIKLWEDRLRSYSAEDPAMKFVVSGDAFYPTRLAACWDRPPFLFVRGAFADTMPAIAIVGSRDVSSETFGQARFVASYMAERGSSIVSGLALGVDTAAHLGALDAGGHTVAVMGTGLREVYPPSNIELSRDVASRGALISQFAPYAPRTGTSFLRRNSVIAGLADVSLVMDGRSRSGSRHEGEQALRQGRKLLLWAATLSKEEWALHMVSDGGAVFVDSAEEVASMLVPA